MQKTFGRVLTAMITPFTPEGAVDYEGAITLANYLFDHGSDGLVICGTTGESPTIPVEEKIQLFKTLVARCKGKGTLIANTGSNDTASTIALSKAAAETGVDGIMLVVPYYNKPNQNGLLLHFGSVAKEVSLPIMVYNVPGRTGGRILPATLERLHKTFPHICAVKDAAGDLSVTIEIFNRLGNKDFMIYSGDDGLTLPILSVGGCGVISVASHIDGDKIQAMIKAFVAGDHTKARNLNKELTPLFQNMFITTNPIPVKYAVRQLGLPAGPFHAPMCEPTEAEAALIDAILTKYKK